MSEFIIFDFVSTTGKTDVYSVRNKITGDRLGLIKWYSPWRKYTFQNDGLSIFDADCLDSITIFLRELMARRSGERGR